MKQFAVIAAVVISLQAAQRPPQTTRPTPARASRAESKEAAKEPRGAEPLAVLNAERAWTGAEPLWRFLVGPDASDDRPTRDAAVRAIGRLEDPGQVRQLFSLTDVTISAVANAIAQSLQGFDQTRDPLLLSEVQQWMRLKAGGEAATTMPQAGAVAALAPHMSRITYANAAQVADIEEMLSEMAANTRHLSTPPFPGWYLAALKGLDALARTNTRLVAFDKETVKRLADSVRGQAANDSGPARRYAFLALVAARALDADTERKALADGDDWQLRRSAMAVLAGAGAGVDDDTKILLIREGLKDGTPHVRYEAVRAYARHVAASKGCLPLLAAMKDEDTTVALEAIDLLGDVCKEDGDVTTRLNAEARVPPSNQYWHRQTHAFVALSKRSPEAAALQMEAFVTHPVWWVRMYAAFAAAGARDLLHLEKLAYDENDNVREAALSHLWALDRERAERATAAALERTDVQLIHTTAGLIKEAPRSPRWVAPMVASLDRLTRLRSMTSRDGRLALLDAIEHHAKAEDQTQLLPWLRDFDPVVARRAADVILRLSGKPAKAEPTPSAHIPTQPFPDLRQCVVVNMSPGKPFKMRMDPASAPIAVEQFLKLATMDRYYNGLAIHRVVPNFVIQGGSPGANEYAGYKEYLRDEVAGSNVRGSVGLSIRGRNTGDAQFYVNLVDNPRLDGGYTVFAHVFEDDMDVVDRIQEGDVMRSIDSTPCATPRR